MLQFFFELKGPNEAHSPVWFQREQEWLNGIVDLWWDFWSCQAFQSLAYMAFWRRKQCVPEHNLLWNIDFGQFTCAHVRYVWDYCHCQNIQKADFKTMHKLIDAVWTDNTWLENTITSSHHWHTSYKLQNGEIVSPFHSTQLHIMQSAKWWYFVTCSANTSPTPPSSAAVPPPTDALHLNSPLLHTLLLLLILLSLPLKTRQ